MSSTGIERVRAVLRGFVERYGPNSPFGERAPEMFVREVLGVEPEPYQIDVLRAFGRGERRISFRSCHGVGKTAVASWLCWLMLCTRFPQKTAITAPTKGQLEDALMAEIGAWHRRLPADIQQFFEVTAHRVELKAAPDDSFLTAKTARDETPEALQGVHSANVLLIGDEASGIGEKIFEAAVGSMSGENATTLLLGNPVRTSGYFFETFHSMSHLWYTIHVTGVKGTERGADHRSYYSSRVTQDYLDQIAATYGKGSPQWRVRALGEFPLADDNVIIPFELVESARQRDIVIPPLLSEVWGLDVARYGGDKNALVRRTRLHVIPKIQTWDGMNLMQTVGKLKREYDDAYIKPDIIVIDEIGMGAGVLDRARELGLPVRGVNVSERKGIDERYYNVRTQLWFRGREWLDGHNRLLPAVCECGKCPKGKDNHAEILQRELTRTRYRFSQSTGEMQAESKDDLRSRGYPSPNVADAFLLTLAGDVATMMHGTKTNRTAAYGSEPLRRRRSFV